eukprot:NODE_433_length_7485_cov_0.465746.p4 type:complete len:259 gc:universal NODE_433_length_7485_cov_0.465746:3463-4239(+)
MIFTLADAYKICWGGALCLFLQNLLMAIITFERKRSEKLFFMILLGLVLCIIEATLVFAKPVIGSSLELKIIKNVVWVCIVQNSIWLYCERIRSLGSVLDSDKYLKYIPSVVLILQLPSVMVNLIAAIEDLFDKTIFFSVFVTIFFLGIILIEIYLYIQLFKKLDIVLSDKPNKNEKLQLNLKLSTIVVSFMELLLAILRCFYPINFILSPIIYLLRISVLMQFYNNLVPESARDRIDSLRQNSYSTEPLDFSYFSQT